MPTTNEPSGDEWDEEFEELTGRTGLVDAETGHLIEQPEAWWRAEDAEARDFRLSDAPRWRSLGTDPKTGACALARPDGLTEITYGDGTVDVV